MIVIQLIVYCALFTAMVKYAVKDSAIEGIFFYPKPVQERAIEIGLVDPQVMAKKRNRFMILFFTVMTVALILIIGVWNRVSNFKEAYLQALLFLEVMNWFDGIVIDKGWVGYSRFWIIPGLENVPYIQTWPQVLKKRVIYSLMWVAGAAIVALLAIGAHNMILLIG